MIPGLLRKLALGRLREIVPVVVLRHLSRALKLSRLGSTAVRRTITSWDEDLERSLVWSTSRFRLASYRRRGLRPFGLFRALAGLSDGSGGGSLNLSHAQWPGAASVKML